MSDCDRLFHSYRVHLVCDECHINITKDIRVPCFSLIPRAIVKKVGCKNCRNKDNFAPLLFSCNIGDFDTHNYPKQIFQGIGGWVKNIDY